MGGARAQIAGAFATYAIGRVTGHRRVATVGGDLIRAQVLSQAMTAGIKLSSAAESSRRRRVLISIRPFFGDVCDRNRGAAPLRLEGGRSRVRARVLRRRVACTSETTFLQRRGLRRGCRRRRRTDGHRRTRPRTIYCVANGFPEPRAACHSFCWTSARPRFPRLSTPESDPTQDTKNAKTRKALQCSQRRGAATPRNMPF